MQINRALDDEIMDHIDHALGRPIDPMAEGSQNRFALEEEGADVAAFRASPYWKEGSTRYGMTHFHVTTEGRRALRKHLKDIGQTPKLFDVTGFGHTRTVVAKSRSAARYERYLDADCDMPFIEYIRHLTVRAAR
jgi:hypothetical protein